MPALITHHLFGEESMGLIPEGIIASEDERIAFLIANQGPDPFFFRFRSVGAPDCGRLARAMHRSRMSRQFAALREGVKHLHKRDAGVGRAFVLGLLSHYALDRAAHPFVYAQQWGIQRVDGSLAESGSEVHAVIETDLDILMLQLKRGGATVADCPPEGELATTDRVNKVAGALMSFMAYGVYGISVGASEYGGAVSDMKLVYRIIEPAGSPSQVALATCEGLVRNRSLLGALAHPVSSEVPAGAGNLAHRPWADPFTGERSSESFPEVFERALGSYRSLARGFAEGVSTEVMTGHVNYSGRVLDLAEEFDREE